MKSLNQIKSELIQAAVFNAIVIIVCSVIIVVSGVVICTALRDMRLANGHIPHDQDPRITQQLNK